MLISIVSWYEMRYNINTKVIGMQQVIPRKWLMQPLDPRTADSERTVMTWRGIKPV